MAKHTFKQSTATGDTRIIARSALGYDWNYLADAETFLFGSTDETAFRMQNMTAGSGITSATGEIYKANVEVAGDLITTTILIDITGLNSSAGGDIIGDDGEANCHIGQITAALNGTIFAGMMTCLEVPTTGDPDIDVFTSTVATGTEDVAISGLAGQAAMLTSGGDWTLMLTKAFTAFPAANSYLYLTNGGGTTDATYAAGIYKIELFGYPA